MSAQEIAKIVENVGFSMEVEGFSIPDDQKKLWEKILRGEENASAILAAYIADAKKMGTAS